MKNWYLTFFLILLIILLAFWNLDSNKQVRQDLSKACRGDRKCIEQVNNVNPEQLEQIKRETNRCNNSPQCIELYTFGTGKYVKPNQHIFIPKTHDVSN